MLNANRTLTTGRFTPTQTPSDPPSGSFTVSDGVPLLTANCRTNDGCYESVFLPMHVEKVALQNI